MNRQGYFEVVSTGTDNRKKLLTSWFNGLTASKMDDRYIRPRGWR